MAREITRKLKKVKGSVLAESEKAYLFLMDSSTDEDDAVWIPKSRSEWDDEKGVLEMELWLAKQHDLD